VPKTPRKEMSLWAQVGFYSSLGFILPAGALGGFGLGWLLDRRFGSSPVLALVLGFAGAAAGVVEVLRILGRAEKENDTRDGHNGPSAG